MRSSKEIKIEIQKIREADRRYNNVVNEGGEGFERDSVPDSLRDELAAALKVEFGRDWPRQVTIERREKWNATVRSKASSGIQFTSRDIEKELGYSMTDLLRAVSIHELKEYKK